MQLFLSCALTSLLDSVFLDHCLLGIGAATGYTDVWEHSEVTAPDVGRSSFVEDLYSSELEFERFHHRKPPGMRGSACVEVMTTLHGSAPSLRRRAEGCVPSGLFVVPSWSVIPPIVTPVTIIEDPHSRMDRLERRIRQMRDLDEMISWDDPDDVPVATLPVGFRMPDIERYTGVGCPRIHLRLYSTVMRALGLDEAQLLTLFPLSLSGTTQRCDTSVTRRELEFLRQGSDESVSSFISRWREKAAEMIERPTERDQMSMFFRSLHPRFARHLTGVPFHDFRSLVQALFDIDDGISRGLWSDITPSPDTEGKGVVGSSETPFYASSSCHGATFISFHCPQTSIPRHEQSRPHRRRQRTYSDLGMPLDRAFERLRSTGFLVPLAPRPLPSTLPPHFRAHEFCAFHQMAGHRTDYCASLRHTIQDLIDSGAPIPHMQFLLLRAYTITFWTPRSCFIVSDSSLYPLFREVLDSFSVVTGPREIDGMMVMIQSTLRLDFFTYFVGVSIVIERSSRISEAFIATFDFTDICYFGCLTSTTSPTFSAPAAFLIHFIGYVDTTSIPAMGFLAPTAPRALPDPVPSQFRLDLYCTPCMQTPSPAVPDLVDLGN
ncbi:hypothetical protein AAG906_026567 [Vitis piasezkii]